MPCCSLQQHGTCISPSFHARSSGAGGPEVADCQNAHSMAFAVRAILELFRLVKREKEIDREILAFSVSHNHDSVRIYGHYPVIEGKDTKYYRHAIHKFDFTVLDGKERWTAYKFTKNVYNNWMPNHFKRICSAVDKIPLNTDFGVSQGSELQFSGQTSVSASVVGEDRLNVMNDENMTSDTTISRTFKRTRREP